MRPSDTILAHTLLTVAAAWLVPVAALAADPIYPPEVTIPGGSTGNATIMALPPQFLGRKTNVPGGITLVPGTVATPGVSGAGVTGKVPLAGLPGSQGVPEFDPGLAPQQAEPNTLYPTLGPAIAVPGSNQSALPQTVPGTNGVPPSVVVCPANAVRSDGSC
jgi:hypothetical protein